MSPNGDGKGWRVEGELWGGVGEEIRYTEVCVFVCLREYESIRE